MAMLYLRNKPIGAISSGASGGGHTIENPSGTDMTQRLNLQFTDADVADDSTNDRTEISVVRKLTQAEFDELTPEEQNRGVIVIKDANPIYVPSNNAVSVVADGVKTWATLLNELFALVDMSRVTRNSCVIEAGESIYRIDDTDFSTRMRFTTALSTFSSPNYYLSTMNVKASDSNWSVTVGSVVNKGNMVPTSGTTISLYYNLIASPGVGDITAEDVSYESGTVADAISSIETEVSTLQKGFKSQTMNVTTGSNGDVGLGLYAQDIQIVTVYASGTWANVGLYLVNGEWGIRADKPNTTLRIAITYYDV